MVVAAILGFLVVAGTGATTQAGADPVLAAAGDIACKPGQVADSAHCQQLETGSLIHNANPAAVAELGDEQYDGGLYAEFMGSYDPAWKALNPVSHPVAGNHEYDQSSAATGYFQYFGTLAGGPQGYYSYDLGSWHIVALNSNCSDAGCSSVDGAGGAVSTTEVQWLHSDLAAHQGQCTLAYWHHPRFSQGWVGGGPAVRPLWDELYTHGADVVLNGHDHVYQRFSPLSPAGLPDAGRGIREFVSGEGGRSLPGFPAPPVAPVQQSDDSHFGALFLTLHGGSYDWSFRAVGQAGSLDQGSAFCHEPQVSISTSPAAPKAAQGVTFDAHAVTPDAAGIAGYAWNFGDGATSPSPFPSHAYAHGGTYSVTVAVRSNNGAWTTKQAAITVDGQPPPASSATAPDQAPPNPPSSPPAASSTIPPTVTPSVAPTSIRAHRSTCAGLQRKALRLCRARGRYARALTSCRRLRGKRRARCTTNAERTYRHDLAQARCVGLRGKRRGACNRQARKMIGSILRGSH